MTSISISDPTWLATFPILLTPKPEEWLPGLFLRYDEANGWKSKTTVLHALHGRTEKFHRSWQTNSPNLIVIPPNSLKIEYLSQILAISKEDIIKSTYQSEAERIIKRTRIQPRHIVTSYSFHICPECIANDRIIRRDTALLHLKSCPKHNIMFCYNCICGTKLNLFRKNTKPYTCSTCELDWSYLPKIKPFPEIEDLDKQIFSWYSFFFSRENDSLFNLSTFYIVNNKPKKLILDYKDSSTLRSIPKIHYPLIPSVSTVVAMLVEREIYPQTLERAYIYRLP